MSNSNQEKHSKEELKEELNTHSEESKVEADESKKVDEEVAEAAQDEEVSEEDELATLTQQVEELEDQTLRLQAEIQNMRRINQRDRQESAKYRSQSLAGELIDALDNLERALGTEVTSEDAQTLKQGVEMVYKQILTAFESEKIKQTNPIGEEFDPNFEQAVSVLPKEEGQEAGVVVNVLQKGYVLDDRVIRPAMVIVSE